MAESEESKVNAGKEKPELSKAEIEEMSEWFYFFDKNNDQKLDIQELGKVFSAMQWDLTDEELNEAMQKADTDGNGYIDFDEYMNLLNTFRKDPHLEKVELIEAFRVCNIDVGKTTSCG